MIAYLIKIIIGSAILFAFYYFFLRNEKTFKFNRFYLIGSLILSFIIPFISFELPTTNNHENIIYTYTLEEPLQNAIIQPIKSENNTSVSMIFWWIYGVISTLFIVRLCTNLIKISRLKGEITFYEGIEIKKLHQRISPFSFFNTIYLSKENYENINDSILIHEACHVKQKHSWDLIIIEVLICVFWINPLIYIYRKFIKQNHEYLADDYVLSKKPTDFKNYQHLLLQELGNTNQYTLSHPFFNHIKKRFIMMSKTKNNRNWKPFLAFPLVLALIFIGAEKTHASEITTNISEKIQQNEPLSTVNTDVNNPFDEFNKILDKYRPLLDNNKIKEFLKQLTTEDKKALGELYFQLTDEQKKQIPLVFTIAKKSQKSTPTQSQINDFMDSKKYGVWIDDKKVKNDILKNYNPKDFSYVAVSGVYPNARSKKNPQPFQVGLMTNEYYQKYIQEESSPSLGIKVNPSQYAKNATNQNP